MKLQNLAIVRFVKNCLEKHRRYADFKKGIAWKKAHPKLVDQYPVEYTYKVEKRSDGILTASVLKNGIAHCMYYSNIGFEALANFEIGNWKISQKEQELILNDINSYGTNLDGLTICYENPIYKKEKHIFADIVVFLFFLILLFYMLLVLPYLYF